VFDVEFGGSGFRLRVRTNAERRRSNFELNLEPEHEPGREKPEG
jgi:hypothetical protein